MQNLRRFLDERGLPNNYLNGDFLAGGKVGDFLFTGNKAEYVFDSIVNTYKDEKVNNFMLQVLKALENDLDDGYYASKSDVFEKILSSEDYNAFVGNNYSLSFVEND